MSYPATIQRCQHVKTNGTQCGSPALRRRKFCFFHQQWRDQKINLRGRPRRNAVVQLPVLEDGNSIQITLSQIMGLILSKQIDSKDAGLMLYALQTAAINLKNTEFEPRLRQSVVIDPRDIPDTPLGEDLWHKEDFEEEEELEDEEDPEEVERERKLLAQKKEEERQKRIERDIREKRARGERSNFDPNFFDDVDDRYRAPVKPTVPASTVPQSLPRASETSRPVSECSSPANLGTTAPAITQSPTSPMTQSSNSQITNPSMVPQNTSASPSTVSPCLRGETKSQVPPRKPALPALDPYRNHPFRVAMRENPAFRTAVARYFSLPINDRFLDNINPGRIPQSDLDLICSRFGFRFSSRE